ncbi:MAG: CopG family transcriptional regulator [Candidatus Heimdallarchaeota archaeon]
MTKYTSVSIPKVLHGKVEEHIKDTGFTSVSSYVTYVLRQILSEEDRESGEAFSKKDEEKIRQRLKSLGYIE